MGTKRRSVERERPEIRRYLKLAIESGNPEILAELLRRLRDEVGLIIDEATARQVVREEMTSRELDRMTRARPRKR